MDKTFLMIFIISAVKADTSSWTELRVKFELNIDAEDTDSFYKIESTMDEAFENDWIQITNTNDLGLSTLCMSEEDIRACALYDRNGIIAGMQLAIPRTDFERKAIPYNVRNLPVFEMKKLGTKRLEEYWTSMFLIVSPSTLVNGGRDNVDELGEGLWFKNGSIYTEVPTEERKLLINTPYKKQNCIPTIGTHYFYDAEYNSNTCTDIQPYYLLVSNGNVHGLGWQIFGTDESRRSNSISQQMSKRIIEAALPNAPRCLGEWTQEFGVTSVQMYFIEQPWNIRCNQMKDSIIPLPGLRRFLLRSLYATNDIISAITRKIRVYIELLPKLN